MKRDYKSLYGSFDQAQDKPGRNCIRGIALWVSNHLFAKPVANKLSYVDAAEIDSRINDLPGEICQMSCQPRGIVY